MEKVLVLVGQTAVGKTALSLSLAKALDGEIINGDAFQVYKELNIITDKIQEKDTQGINHHLINIKSIQENYSVEEHQKNIRDKIKEISSRGKLPIIVGGTGFYIKAALYDYQFEKEKITNQEIEKKYENYTNEQLYELLKSFDPQSCEKIHQNNRRRVLRAISIFQNSGKSKSEIINSQNHHVLYDAIIINLELAKDVINQRIDARIDDMFREGIIEEVSNNFTTSTASKAIGYSEIMSYLNHEISLDEAKKLMKIHTHQYAKRQRTWYRHQFDSYLVLNDQHAFNHILEIIEKNWNCDHIK